MLYVWHLLHTHLLFIVSTMQYIVQCCFAHARTPSYGVLQRIAVSMHCECGVLLCRKRGYMPVKYMFTHTPWWVIAIPACPLGQFTPKRRLLL